MGISFVFSLILLLISLHSRVSGLTPADSSSSAIESVCLAFQAAQNSLNGSAAGLLFSVNGTSEVPAGSTPNVGPAAIGKAFQSYFDTLLYQHEVIITPILINSQWAAYNKVAVGKAKSSGSVFSTMELNWFEFDLSGSAPLIKSFRALFTDYNITSTEQ